jgi:hypothetical protein
MAPQLALGLQRRQRLAQLRPRQAKAHCELALGRQLVARCKVALGKKAAQSRKRGPRAHLMDRHGSFSTKAKIGSTFMLLILLSNSSDIDAQTGRRVMFSQ